MIISEQRGQRQVSSNLPTPLTPLIGREQDLQAARSRLLRSEVRLLTLTGTAGIGKTRLALALGESLFEEFAHGVCFVSLAPISDPELVMPTIAHALDIPESDMRPMLERVSSCLREKSLLLLLDNFEHVLPAAPLLVELLSACPHLKVLVTSRATLRVQGEFMFPVPPLAVPDQRVPPTSEDLDSLSQVAAVELFVQRVEAYKPDFRLTERNAVSVAEICKRLGGVPLTIELAAARCNLLTPQALLSRLGHSLEVLDGGRQDAPNHQQTLRSTIDWSYNLLKADEQTLFRQLSVFVGDFPLEAAEGISTTSGDLSISVLHGVASLVDKSLLQQREEEGQEPRLSLLESMREYGLERLSECGELERVRDAHAAYYLALSEEAEPGLDEATQLTCLEVLDREYENMRVAMQWLVARRDAQGALRIASALRQFWVLRARLREGVGELEQALEALGEANIQGADQIRAKALYTLGYLLFFAHELERAAVLLQESLDLFRRLQDQQGIADSLRWLGMIMHDRGEVVQGTAMDEESLSLSRAIGDSRGSAYTLNLLGGACLACGEYDRAYQLYQESLALFRAMGNMWGSAANLHFLGMVQLALGAITEARSLAEESLALLHRFKTPYLIVDVLTVYAFEATVLGEETSASALVEEAQTLARQTGTAEDLARMCWGVGHLALRQGNLAVAREMYVQCVKALQRKATHPRFKWVIASCLEGLAEIGLAGEQALWAVQLVGAAEALRHVHEYYSPLCIERTIYDHTLAEARRKLGEQAFAAAWAAGQEMTPQQALEAETKAPQTPLPTQDAIVSLAKPQPTLAPVYPHGLTSREVEVLRLVAQGMSNNQIAEQLVLSPNTVNAHVQSIYRKLDVNSRSTATRFAVEKHLL